MFCRPLPSTERTITSQRNPTTESHDAADQQTKQKIKVSVRVRASVAVAVAVAVRGSVRADAWRGCHGWCAGGALWAVRAQGVAVPVPMRAECTRPHVCLSLSVCERVCASECPCECLCMSMCVCVHVLVHVCD